MNQVENIGRYYEVWGFGTSYTQHEGNPIDMGPEDNVLPGWYPQEIQSKVLRLQ